MATNKNFTEQSTSCCRRICVFGLVQGVGFRPFVFRLAKEIGLTGWVRNAASGVEIIAEGDEVRIDELIDRLRPEAPPLARVDRIEQEDITGHYNDFSILPSVATAPVSTIIGYDTAVCADCLTELFDPCDRRWRFPFINCTHCGPRYTLTSRLPYDRATTSMAPFTLCPACSAEYEDPGSRRFHAEANACPDCGPRLESDRPDRDPIARTLEWLLTGRIVAIKGLGGFHLACDADNPAAVARLRLNKGRDEKPFALMVANLTSARRWAIINEHEARLLTSPERPIVLLPTRADPAAIAPGLAHVGLMLPYTPLHYLLFHEYAGRPAGNGWLDEDVGLSLVMTSANPGGEPIVIDNDAARGRLAGIAEVFLCHDRKIVSRCDDTVLRAAPDHPTQIQFVRRARGFTPRAIEIGSDGPPVLALGAYFNNTICLTRGREAFMSAHIGDLDDAATCEALVETVDRLRRLLAVDPEVIVHDLHPDFYSTRLAHELAAGRRCLAVQHHHAHIGAVLAEHRHTGPVLGLALDGIGLGSDGSLWGGELLRVDGAQMHRVGHLCTLPLPGGDRAAREPWRMAAAILHRLGRDGEIEQRFAAHRGAALIGSMIDSKTHCPETSSLGRHFDAAAALLGIRDTNGYEGQAAMRLEALAIGYGKVAALAGGWTIGSGLLLDLMPLLAALAGLKKDEQGYGAALFHATLVAALADWAMLAAAHEKITTVAFGGGCFLNTLLSAGLAARLENSGLHVLVPRQTSPGDGGIALGQAWIAQQQEP